MDKEQFGFLTIAQNNSTTDYLNLAYIQAQNIKATQKNNKYAVIVDADTYKHVTKQHRTVFDYVIQLPSDHARDEQWKMSNEWQVFSLSPFKETIKLESDMLFTRDIGHWVSALRLKDICFSLHCRDYQGNVKVETPYRKQFTDNLLPDIYTGMYYFRYSQTSFEFFKLATCIYKNWHQVTSALTQVEEISTDVAMAVAVNIFGRDQCTIPTLDFFNFVHMKSGIQGWSDTQPWTDYVNVEQDHNMLRINNVNQYQPVHYYDKRFNQIITS